MPIKIKLDQINKELSHAAEVAIILRDFFPYRG
jgi:hypothetical protein